MPSKLERDFQSSLIREIKDRWRGCIVLKNDSQYKQGVPDLTVLYGPHWFILEVKKSLGAPFRPNQEYYIEQWGVMGHAAVIAPENKKEILDAMDDAFYPC